MRKPLEQIQTSHQKEPNLSTTDLKIRRKSAGPEEYRNNLLRKKNKKGTYLTSSELFPTPESPMINSLNK
jgi:hypothetical protein